MKSTAPPLWSLRAAVFLMLCLVGGPSNHAAAQSAPSLRSIMDELQRVEHEAEEYIHDGKMRTCQSGPKQGELEGSTPLSGPAADVMNRVNRLRVAYFQASQRTEAEMRASYSEAMQKHETASGDNQTQVILSIQGSPLMAEGIMETLLTEFLKSQGYTDVHKQPVGPAARPSGYILAARRPDQREQDAVLVRFSSSSEALRALAGSPGTACDLALVSRPVQADENKSFLLSQLGDLTLPAYVSVAAQDGLALLANSSCPSTAMSVPGLVDLLKMHPGASPLKWHVLAGVHDLGDLDDYLQLNFNVSVAPGSIPHDTEPELFRALAEDNNGLALVSCAHALRAVEDPAYGGKLMILPISTAPNTEAEMPSRFSIRSETYPLTRPLLMCVTRRRSALTKQFRDFVASTEGQNLVRQARFVDRAPCDKDERAHWSPAEQRQWEEQEAKLRGKYRDQKFLDHCDLSGTPFVIHFKSDRTEVELYSGLNPDALPNIRNLVADFARNGGRANPNRVVLIGHTDNQGNHDYNLALGYRRAASLKAELESMGIPVESFKGDPPKGNPPLFAKGQPISPNTSGDLRPLVTIDNAEGWARNRRVELWLRRSGD